METEYHKEELVWAKLHSFPWWPGIVKFTKISSIKSTESETVYKVDFIGENTQ